MQATFSAAGVDLYLGDAAVVIPELNDTLFDLIATDPPYGVRFSSHWREKDKQFTVMHGDSGEVDVPAVLKACAEKLRKCRHVYVFGPETLMEGVDALTAKATLIWDKGALGLGDLSLPYGTSHEPITFAAYVPSKADRDRNKSGLSARLRKGSILRVTRPSLVGTLKHPTEKPVALMRQLIESSTCHGELVCDPFMGSGSTVIAALLEGRRAVGIEIDPKYFEVAKRRVESLLPMLSKLDAA